MRVLVVDDENLLVKGIKFNLQNEGYEVLTGSDGQEALEIASSQDLDLIILENVGNLVCPAEFDTGASMNMTILSVPEGDDKPLKYPLMYETCDLLVINKVDVEGYFDFDRNKVVEYAKMRNPNIHILFVSAKTGEGIPELAQWILEQVSSWNREAL